MLALRAYRSPFPLVARAYPRAANSHLATGTEAPVARLLDDLTAPDSGPPTAGSDGYPPPTATENPFSQSGIDKYTKPTPKYRLHCHSTRNNTIMTFTRPTGEPIAWFSGGSCGFKKVNRSSYEAGYQCAVRIFKKIEEISTKEYMEVDLFFKGFGQGRDALQRALMTTEGGNSKESASAIAML